MAGWGGAGARTIGSGSISVPGIRMWPSLGDHCPAYHRQ